METKLIHEIRLIDQTKQRQWKSGPCGERNHYESQVNMATTESLRSEPMACLKFPYTASAV